jgi:hypothetical protein
LSSSSTNGENVSEEDSDEASNNDKSFSEKNSDKASDDETSSLETCVSDDSNARKRKSNSGKKPKFKIPRNLVAN